MPRWRVRAFVVSHAIALLLTASWLLPPFEGWWDAVDNLVFRFLNGSLDGPRSWQVFWALANHRAVDLFSGSVFGLVVLAWLWGETRQVQQWRCALLGALSISVVIFPFIFHEIIQLVFKFERWSPTMVSEGAIWLTRQVPEIATKDASRFSFPGDHAFVLCSIVLFFIYLGARKMVAVTVLIAFVFMLPRLVSGAHWLTDNVMGGAVPALLVTAWMLATPAGATLAAKLLPLVRWVLGLVPSWLLRSKDA